MSEEAGLDVFGPQGFPQQRIVQQVDLPDGQIVRRPPPGVDAGELLIGERTAVHRCPVIVAPSSLPARTRVCTQLPVCAANGQRSGEIEARHAGYTRACAAAWRRERPATTAQAATSTA